MCVCVVCVCVSCCRDERDKTTVPFVDVHSTDSWQFKGCGTKSTNTYVLHKHMCVLCVCISHMPNKGWPLTTAAGKGAQKYHQQGISEEFPSHSETFTQIESDLWLYRKELQDEAEEGKVSEFKFLDRKIDRERMVQDKDVSVGFSRQESHSAVLATHIYMVLWFLNYISQRMAFIKRLKD